MEALSKDRVDQAAEAKEGEPAEAKENVAVEGKENGSVEAVVNAAGQRMVKFVPFILEDSSMNLLFSAVLLRSLHRAG